MTLSPRMANLSPTSKIPISRLDHDEKPPRMNRPSRTQRACDHCRKRKVRCTGETPRCQNCIDQDAACVYTQARRDRLNEATEQNSRLVSLLKDLSIHVDGSGKRMIEEQLESLGEDYTPVSAAPSTLKAENRGELQPSGPSQTGKRSRPRETSPSNNRGREGGPRSATVSDSVGTGDLDLLDEDLLRTHESRATGFVGNNSSIQWMRSLKSHMGNSDTKRNVSEGKVSTEPDMRCDPTFRQADGSIRLTSEILHVSDSTFYLDRNDLQLDDVVVDPYELPKPDVAERLFNAYIQTVHASFPILPVIFEAQFRRYIDSAKKGRPYQLPEEWQAMLNLVFAIGAQYSHLIQAGWENTPTDHLVYMTRATRILRLDKLATSLPSPSLSFIQCTGLLALYYLTIGQVSRGWMMIGISLRFALAAGLHLRNEDPSAPVAKTETLIRTWWSLHSIETLLCAIIGRPCIIPNDECTVPLPQVLPQFGDSPLSQTSDSTDTSTRGDPDAVTRSSFLGARVTIALLMQKTLHKLYTPRISTDSWGSIQQDIASLMTELDSWAEAAHLAGLSAKSMYEDGVDRHNLLLAFHYQSCKLLICRPCLCRLQRRDGQSDASVEFNAKTADACVTAAQAITWLLPDDPDRNFVYEQTPWWSTVHIIMQAVAVLMLKMSFGPQHMTQRGEQLTGSVRKLVRWLRRLSATSDVAKRAYSVAIDIIRVSSPRIRVDITTPINEEPTPDSHTSMSPFIPTPSSSTPYSDLPTQSAVQTEWDRIYMAQSSKQAASSSITVSPKSVGSTSQLSSSAQLSATNLATNRLRNANAYGAQHQTQDFSNFAFDPNSTLDADMNISSFFGNPFVTNFDQPGPLLDPYYGGEEMGGNTAQMSGQMNMDGTFNLYTNPTRKT